MKRVISALLCMIILFVTVFSTSVNVYATQTRSSNFSSNYSLTGNWRNDIVAVASAQYKKIQSDLGYTEYWCADFVCDCAKLAGIPNFPYYGGCDGLLTRLVSWGGIWHKYSSSYVPQKGDIVFFSKYSNTSSDSTHVGIVYSSGFNSDGSINTIEGNTSGVSTSCVNIKKRSISYSNISQLYILGYIELPNNSHDTTYFNASFTARSSLIAKSEPYGSSTTKRTISNGSTVNVVGYTYNSYGNLWYKTDKGDYLHANYLEYVNGDGLPPSNYLTGTMEVVCSSKAVRQDINSDSELKRTIYKGNTVNIIGYQYNEYGNLWYVLSDGTYTYCSYLSVKNSSIRTPSNYLNGERLKVVASSKSVRRDPYIASDLIRTVKSGDIVTVDGYLYNRYGNLWYLTDKDDYIYESYLQKTENASNSPSNYEIRYLTTDSDKAAKTDPYSVADTIEDIPKGNSIKTIGYVYNLYGNKWYETEDYFIHDSNLSCAHQYKLTSQTSPTCTTEGAKKYTCSQCDKSYSEKIAAKGHTVVAVTGKAATCTSTGLTEGSKCSVCGTILKAQQTIAAKGHTFSNWTTSKAATCTDTGTESRTCTVCKHLESRTTSAKGHTAVTVAGKPATCTDTGLTDGSKCSVCGIILNAQQVIAAKGHSFENWVTSKSATCTDTGTESRTCTACKYTENRATSAKGHTVVTVAGKPATCTSTGLADGSKCSVCKTIIKAQETIPLIAHNYISKVIAPTVNSQGYTLHTCSVCRNSYKDNYTDPVVENAPKIIVGNQNVVIGKTVEVKISIKDNPGITSMRLHVNYDTSALTLIGVTDGGILGTKNHPENLSTYPYILSWANDTMHENYTDDGTLVTLTFAVSSDAQPGDYEINVSYDNNLDEITDVDMNTVDFSVTNGTLSVLNVLIGDVNGDGKVTSKDRIILSRYLDNWEGYETLANPLAADINGDGKITSKDRIILSRYLDGWGSAYDIYFK